MFAMTLRPPLLTGTMWSAQSLRFFPQQAHRWWTARHFFSNSAADHEPPPRMRALRLWACALKNASIFGVRLYLRRHATALGVFE